METDEGGLFIYYDTKVKDNIVTINSLISPIAEQYHWRYS